MNPEKINVVLLSACMALGMSVTSLVMTSAAVAGALIAPDRGLATLPVALMFLGLMGTTLPAALVMHRVGRRAGFAIGALIGVAGGIVAALGMLRADFLVFSSGMVLLGMSGAFTQQYRFAAADVASPAFRPTAIAWVMAGGIVSAFLGPNVATWTKDLVESAAFAGTFAVVPLFQASVLVLLVFVDLPPVQRRAAEGPARPLGRIMAQPAFIAAVSGAVVGYAGMNIVMTTTPLAVMDHAHGFDDAAFVLQWHIIGMYLPAFFMGAFIARFGAPLVMLAGAVLYAGCVGLNLSGSDLMLSFWPALILLGIGWSCLFVGGTSLLTETYAPSEKAKIQGLNDFLVFTSVAASALLSGKVYAEGGWVANNIVLLVLSGLAAVVMVWAMRVRRTAPVAETA